MNWKNSRSAAGFCLALSVVTYSSESYAADSNAGILDGVLDGFKAVASTWSTTLLSYATWLFWGLMLISLVWTFGTMALKGGGLQDALAEMIRFFAVGGFFFYLLQHGPAISMSIIDTCRDIAGSAVGGSSGLSPSGIVDIGFEVFDRVVDQSSLWSPVSSACGMLIGLAVLVTLALVGVNMLLLMVSSWILCYGGIIFLGFGGGRWTTDMAINYYKTALNVGMQLFGMSLVIGIGQSFIDKYYDAMNASISMKDMAVLLVCCVVLLALTNKIPPLLGSLVGGHSGGGGGIGSFGAGAAMAAATTGAALAMNGVTHAASGASAIKDAVASAQQYLAGGAGKSDAGDSGGDLSGFAGAGGDPSFQAAGTDGNEKRGSMFAQAMGTAGRSNDFVSARTSGTTGSTPAQKPSNDQRAPDTTSHGFGHNGIGPGRGPHPSAESHVNPNAEIAAFVNKGA